MSALTGYALATAIVGGAVFVDRVLYGGPDEQRLALGSLAGAMAVGALASGFIVRVVSLRLVTLLGLAASVVALVVMSRWTTDTPIGAASIALAVFGLGFGATVTPRSTAAVAAVSSRAVRHGGLDGHRGPDGRHGRRPRDPHRVRLDHHRPPLRPGLRDARRVQALHPREPRRIARCGTGSSIEALETWAAGEAAQIMVGVFLVAAVVTAVAIPPALLLDRRRMLGSAVPVPNPDGGNPATDGAADPDAGIDPDLELPVIGGA